MGRNPQAAGQSGWKVSALPLFRVRDSCEWQTVEIERPANENARRVSLVVELPSHGWRTRLTWARDQRWARVEIPCAESPAAIRLRWGQKPQRRLDFPLPGRRRWRIHLLHHTHVDIGYTDLPSRVCEQQAEILDQVVSLCERTREYPAPARFRWTNECFWPVVNYLGRRPQRHVNALIRWMRRGAIENTALYMNMTELWTEEMIARSLCHAVRFCSQHRLPLEVGAQTDCPGVSWAVPQALNQIGVRYLAMSTNSIRARVPRLSRPFRWRTPAGEVLVWNSDPEQGHYGEGRSHGFSLGYKEALERMPRVLALYEAQGYPYPVCGFHVAMDNCYPIPDLSDTVRQWNEQWVAPQLRISTFREFFRELEPLADGCDVAQGAWPDWWADGHASAAFHTARARRLWRGLDGLERAQAVLAPHLDIHDAAEQALEGLFLFDEHTWGAQRSALRPFSSTVMAHWAEKELPLWRAGNDLEAVEQRLGERFGPQEQQHRLVVMNPSLQARHALVAAARLPALEPGESSSTGRSAPTARAARSWEVTDADAGEGLACQMLHPDHTDPQRRGELVIVVPELGGLCARRLCARTVESSSIKRQAGLAQAALRSQHYELRWTQAEGVISFRDAVRNREWVTPGAALGRLLVERPAARSGQQQPHCRFSPHDRSRATHESGPVFDSLTWTEALEGTGEVIWCARLYHACPRLELVLRINKLEVTAPEALFVAFPFEAAHPQFMIDAPGGSFAPEVQQIPGSARDYYHVEAGLALWDGKDWLALCSPDAPLFHLQQPHTARWLERLDIRTGHVFSNPMSNYWHTNFRPSQPGWVELAYVLTRGRGNPREQALWSLRQSCADAVVLGGWPQAHFPPMKLLDGTVDLLSLRREGHTLWIRLKEMTGRPTRCVLGFAKPRPLSVERTDPCGGNPIALKLRRELLEIALGPYETATLRARFRGAGQSK